MSESSANLDQSNRKLNNPEESGGSFEDSLETVYQEEKSTLKENYKAYESLIGKLKSYYDDAAAKFKKGGYEPGSAFMAAGDVSSALKVYNSAKTTYDELYPKPYFGHIRLEIRDEGEEPEVEEFFMSDNELLDERIELKGFEEKRFIYPFKQDERRDIYNILFHINQEKSGNTVVNKGTEFKPLLIREADIKEAKLVSAQQMYPVIKALKFGGNFDSMLLKKLEENRGSQNLQNIISSLQSEQFDIIRQPVSSDFVVQGCAGSGKSQILIHRLFFLRDTYKDNWDKVLLITPSKLFRDHSADLIRRYRLSSVKNLSLSSLYIELLQTIDPNFKNRQYKIELSEEYLPERYLQQVYSRRTGNVIKTQLNEHIDKHLKNISRLLETEYNSWDQTVILQDIDARIADTEQRIRQCGEVVPEAEIEIKRKRLKELQSFLEKFEKKLEELKAKKTGIEDRIAQTDELNKEYKEKEERLKILETEEDQSLEELRRELNAMAAALNEKHEAESESKINYAEVFAYIEKYILYKETVKEKSKERKNPVVAAIELDMQMILDELEEKTGARNFEEALKKNSKEIDKTEEELESLEKIIRSKEKEKSEIEELLRIESGKENIYVLKDKLEALQKEKNYIQRMESTLFEQVVWNTLSEYKKEFGVISENSVLEKDNHVRKDKILYKADLLYYLLIYIALNKTKKVPDYRLICIDEGQDLQPADYGVLKALFPNANCNVFGDTKQVLLPETGVRNWQQDTGVGQVYELKCNYRNKADIVDFCNKNFSTQMEYVGEVSKEKSAVDLKNIGSISSFLAQEHKNNLVVILKDKRSFNVFNKCKGKRKCNLRFIDSSTEEIKVDDKTLKCYSVFAAKGLEFENVLVFAYDMNENQKIVACTRAMSKLYYYNKEG